MAGVDHAGIVRSLKSAGDENQLPCARTLLGQGFCPGDVRAWGETGGIPEEAAPFVLEHYAFAAASPSVLARRVLLSFSRVGINAYLKERLGIAQGAQTPAPVFDVLTTVERSIGLLERLGGVDPRAELLLKDIVLNNAARAAGGEIALLPQIKMLSLQEAFQELGGATPTEATKLACTHGKAMKKLYHDENGRYPKTHKQLVYGRPCDVCDYEFDWLEQHLEDLQQAVLDLRVC